MGNVKEAGWLENPEPYLSPKRQRGSQTPSLMLRASVLGGYAFFSALPRPDSPIVRLDFGRTDFRLSRIAKRITRLSASGGRQPPDLQRNQGAHAPRSPGQSFVVPT